MSKWITAFFMGWGNFLIIPCPVKKWDDNLRKEMLTLLPFIGLIVSLIWGVLSFLLINTPVPIIITAFVLTLYIYGITGFMHLDGFMDTCDAVMSRRDLDERQRILKDSNVGAFAVISVVVLILGMFVSIYSIIDKLAENEWIGTGLEVGFYLIWIPIVSRGASAASVLKQPPIKGSQYEEEEPTEKSINTGYVVRIVFIIVIMLFIVGVIIDNPAYRFLTEGGPEVNSSSTLIGLIATLIFTKLSAYLAKRNLGGINGDIAGFSICIGELAGVMAVAIAIGILEAHP